VPLDLGVVVAFDEQRGLGTLRSERRGPVSFHCTAIADGARTIEPGTAVAFEVVPGALGRFEAKPVWPLGPSR
jgi:cold shock CspA family protein